MLQQFSPKYIIIGLSVLALTLTGVLWWQISQKPAPDIQDNAYLQEEGKIVFQPWSSTAERYYPGGGNAIDFRDGAQGDFQISATKKSGKMVLTWPKEIKVTEVKVYNIGQLANLQDHFPVFSIINFDFTAPPVLPAEGSVVPQEVIPEIFSQPEVYLSPTYEIGKIPTGFFDSTFYTESFVKGSVVFEQGSRYSVELYGINTQGKRLVGYYTFNYE